MSLCVSGEWVRIFMGARVPEYVHGCVILYVYVPFSEAMLYMLHMRGSVGVCV